MGLCNLAPVLRREHSDAERKRGTRGVHARRRVHVRTVRRGPPRLQIRGEA